MSESTTANLYSQIVVAGAPVALDINGSYYQADPSATGGNRVWRTPATQRIFYTQDYGWVVADFVAAVKDDDFHFDGYTIYFFSGNEPAYTAVSGDTNPGDIKTWYTNHKALEPYAAGFALVQTEDPEITTTTETTKDNRYIPATDSTFQFVKSYYTLTGVESHPYAPVAMVVNGNRIPDQTYYVLQDGNYVFTTDPLFKEDVVYYTRVFIGDSTTPFVYLAAAHAGASIPAGLYFEANGVITRITTTTTNNRTGEVTTNTEETVTVSGSSIQEHKRYSIPEVEAGKIYRFSFVGDFYRLGYNNPNSDDYVEDGIEDADITRGVYRLDGTTTYYDLVVGGVDIYQNLYLPLGISKDVFELDKKRWHNGDIWYKLVDPVQDSIVYYVPTSIISGVPDGNVSEFKRYQLIIDIGIFNDPELLTEIITCVNMLFKAHFGIPTSATLAAYDSVWLPNKYYEWLDSERKLSINTFMTTNAPQYFNTLFFNEYNALAKENSSLKASLDTYEQLIGQMSNG